MSIRAMATLWLEAISNRGRRRGPKHWAPGARWVQNEILEKYPKADLKVYAVWFDMIWSDSRSRWPGGALDDPRVVHFWDEDKVLGRWYGSHPRYGHGDDVWWDTYLLYGPESRWQEFPSHLIKIGSTIMDARSELEASLRSLLRPAPRHK